MQQPRFREWERTDSEYHSSRWNEDYTVSLVEGEDTLANIPFDLFMFFVDRPHHGLERVVMLSRNEYNGNNSIDDDLGKVRLALRRKYGIQEWGFPWYYKDEHSGTTTFISCDSLSIGDRKTIRIKEVVDGDFYSNVCDSLILSRYTQR